MTKTLSSSRVRVATVAVVLAWLVFDVHGSPAQAASKRKVGVSLTGSPSSHVREAISVVLKHHGFEVVSADLGGGSDDAIAAAAKQSGLAAVVVGEVRDAGKRLKLRVYGAAGDLVGEGSWSGAPKKLGGAVRRTLWARVGGSLSKARAAGLSKADKDAQEKQDKQDEKEDQNETADEEAEPKAGEPPPTYSRSKDAEARDTGADEGAHKKKKHPAASEEAKAEPDAEEGAAPGAAGRALELGVGPRFLWRNLSWVNDSTLRPYTVGHAPSLGVSLAWYPAAHVMGGVDSNLGVAGALEYTPGLASQTSDGSSFPTSASDFWLGARDRVFLGPLEGALTIGGGQQAFIFHNPAGTTLRESALTDLPDVKYSYLRLGLDLRFALPANLSFLLGGGFRYVLGAGNVNSLLQGPNYFPNAKTLGFEGMAGAGFKILSLLEARVGFDLRRYQITPGASPKYMATGGTDQYLAGWLQLVLVLDGASGDGSKTHTAAHTPSDEAPEKTKGRDKGQDKDDKADKDDKDDKDDKADNADKDGEGSE